MKNNNMKEHILHQGLAVVAEKGFKNTGISEILKSASVPKGSFYYYFDSKTDFGLELINYAARSFLAGIENHFSSDLPPIEKIENFFGEQINHYSDSPCRCNCLFGKLSQELTDEDPRLREGLRNIFEAWQSYFTSALEEASASGSIRLTYPPEMLARFILSGWEGALMQGKLNQSTEPLKEFRDIFLTLISL